jgi:hypothetical protein
MKKCVVQPALLCILLGRAAAEETEPSKWSLLLIMHLHLQNKMRINILHKDRQTFLKSFAYSIPLVTVTFFPDTCNSKLRRRYCTHGQGELMS